MAGVTFALNERAVPPPNCRAALYRVTLQPTTVASFQRRKNLRFCRVDMCVMEAAPERQKCGENRQCGDQTHYSPPVLKLVPED
jgi:hypothetical protein